MLRLKCVPPKAKTGRKRRCQGRYLRLLVEHGKTTHDGHGAVLKSVSKSTRQRLRNVLSRHEYAQAERYFGVYAVVVPGEVVVTAAHRTNRRFH